MYPLYCLKVLKFAPEQIIQRSYNKFSILLRFEIGERFSTVQYKMKRDESNTKYQTPIPILCIRFASSFYTYFTVETRDAPTNRKNCVFLLLVLTADLKTRFYRHTVQAVLLLVGITSKVTTYITLKISIKILFQDFPSTDTKLFFSPDSIRSTVRCSGGRGC